MKVDFIKYDAFRLCKKSKGNTGQQHLLFLYYIRFSLFFYSHISNSPFWLSCFKIIFLTSSYVMSPLSHIAWCIEQSVIKLFLSSFNSSFVLIGIAWWTCKSSWLYFYFVPYNSLKHIWQRYCYAPLFLCISFAI